MSTKHANTVVEVLTKRGQVAGVLIGPAFSDGPSQILLDGQQSIHLVPPRFWRPAGVVEVGEVDD